MINQEELINRSEELMVHTSNIQRDYAFGWVLAGIYLASELRKYLVLKGGNCLRKAYFDTTRFSPDLDFVTTENLRDGFILAELQKVCIYAQENSGIEFILDQTIVKPKRSIDSEIQIYEGRLYFKDFFGELSQIIIGIKLDISMLGKIFLPVQSRNIIHPYSDRSQCTVEIKCLKLEEMLASKLKCLIQRRHSSDLYDFVAATLLKPVVAVDRGEIIEAFFKMTIFRPAPHVVIELFQEFPYITFRNLWDKYLVYPIDAAIDYDNAVETIKSSIQTMFGALPIRSRSNDFYPAKMRNIIMDAGRSQTLLKIKYQGVERLIEPYSLKYKTRMDGISREYLYAYDLSGGKSGPGIKCLIHQNIQNLENTETKFEPKYEIELAKAGEFGSERRFPHNHRNPLLGRIYQKHFQHVIQCPICGKQFRRNTNDNKLRPHKDQYGNNCYGKIGYLVS
jgi:predicted nucleotidyltransferase component of viral defense system